MKTSNPLVSVMKNGKLINDLTEIMLILIESRADYDQFANTGIHSFSQDMTDLAYGFGDIGETMKLDGLNDRLDNAHDLIAKLPSQFMYIMDKAIGSAIGDLREQIQSLNEKPAVVVDLPSNRELLMDPEAHTDKLCPLVNDKKMKITYTIIMARLNLLSVKLDYANGLIPDELTAVVNVVGGGGTSIPFPAKPIGDFLVYIKDSMIQRLENANEIAGIICEDYVMSDES